MVRGQISTDTSAQECFYDLVRELQLTKEEHELLYGKNFKRSLLMLDLLTEREKTALKLLSQGLTHEQVAKEMIISVATLKGHINHIYEKFDLCGLGGATARVRAVRIYWEEGQKFENT